MVCLIAYLAIAVAVALFSGMIFALEFLEKMPRDEENMAAAARWFVRSPVWPIILVPTLARMFKAMLTYGAPR